VDRKIEDAAMSRTYELVCHETRQRMWIGQGQEGMTHLYHGPEQLKLLADFLEVTRGKSLVVLCNDTEGDDWLDYEEFDQALYDLAPADSGLTVNVDASKPLSVNGHPIQPGETIVMDLPGIKMFDANGIELPLRGKWVVNEFGGNGENK